MTVTVHHGDCREVLATLPAESVDSVVCDPPYHLTSIVKRFGKVGAAPNQFGTDGRYARLTKGFMQKEWDAPDAPPIDPAFANWLAGFIDGEGCFHVHKKTVNNCETYDCQFSLSLRADDKPILVEIQRQLGGIGTIADRPARGKGNDKPQARYCVSSKAELQRLREVLSAFPLRAKKARDFEVWSAALDAWLAHEPGGSWEDVAYFRRALMAVRQYGAAFHPSQLFHYQWARETLRVMKPGAHLLAFSGTRTYHRMVAGIEDAGFEIRDCILWLTGQGFPKSHNLDGEWEGWGTALKPAAELIVLARKPFKGTVAANVLQYGTGALNVDGCRIAAGDKGDWPITQRRHDDKAYTLQPVSTDHMNGRWPANVVHDGSEEVLGAFAVYGESKTPNTVTRGSSDSKHGSSNRSGQIQSFPCHGDSGSAARFFKSTPATVEDIAWMTEPVNFAVECSSLQSEAAVSVLANAVAVSMPGSALLQPSYRAPSTSATASEFALLCEIVTATIQSIARRCSHGSPPQSITASVGPATCAATHERTDTMTITASHWRSDGSADPVTFNITLPSAGLGAKVSASRFHYSSKADASDRLGSKHPTIKPVDLMRWLVRLVTPPGGLVLDPFAGSGTTGMAALMEGMRAVLIEREAEYIADINRRLAHMKGGDAPLFAEPAA